MSGMILTVEKSVYSNKSLSQCNFVHHKPHMNWLGFGQGTPGVTGRRLNAREKHMSKNKKKTQ
jgi:hypothetical protein